MKNLRNILFVCSLFFLFNTLSAQEFDEKFLNGLPEDVRDDVLKQLELGQKSNTGDTVLQRRPISKLNLEKSQSERYGIEFFNSVQSSFMPINDPNISGDYILDFGDGIEIYYIGVVNENIKVQITRDGTINLPRIGPIRISGLTLDQASSLIKAKIKTSLTGVEGYITLSDLRDIQILVTGESSFPGIYTLNGNSNLLHALNVSGGISENGSFRSIEIKRGGKTIETVDLYDLIIFGNSSFSQRLQSGDTIYIPAAKILARMGGGFNRVGLFELKEGETFKDLFFIAGGNSRKSLSGNYLLSTFKDNQFKTINFKKSELFLMQVSNDDALYAQEYSTGSVNLTGMVKYPGIYTVSDSDTLSILISRAGGYQKEAYPFGSKLFREKAKILEQDNNTNLYNDFIKFIVGSFNSGVAVDSSLPILLQELKNREVKGRVRTEFNLNKIAADPSLDTLLNNGDNIYIPKYDESIYVYGEIVSPGTTRYKYGMSIDNYIAATGGLSSYADSKRIVIVDPDGKTSLIRNSDGIFNQKNNTLIYPGSVIYIPRNMTKVEGLKAASIIAPLFSSLALSLASLSAIND